MSKYFDYVEEMKRKDDLLKENNLLKRILEEYDLVEGDDKMIKERVTVDLDAQCYYLDGEYWESWDNYGEEMADALNTLLNEQDERIKGLEKELKNRKKLNNIVEGFLLNKGYTFNDIIKFLQDRTEKGGEK